MTENMLGAFKGVPPKPFAQPPRRMSSIDYISSPWYTVFEEMIRCYENGVALTELSSKRKSIADAR